MHEEHLLWHRSTPGLAEKRGFHLVGKDLSMGTAMEQQRRDTGALERDRGDGPALGRWRPF